MGPAHFRTNAKYKEVAEVLESSAFLNSDGSAPLVDVAMRAGVEPSWLAGEMRATFSTAEHARTWVKALAGAEADFLLRGATERLFREAEGEALVDGLTAALQGHQRLTGATGGLVSTADLADRYLVDHAARQRAGQGPPGHRTGLEALDSRTLGGRPGELWILLGKQASGKSTFADWVRRNLGERGVPSILFSGEMLGEQLGQRHAHAQMGMRVEDEIGPLYVDVARERVQGGPGRFMLVAEQPRDTRKGLAEESIDKQVRIAQELHGEIGLVVVDHLGMIRGMPGKDQTERLRYAVLAMKDLAIRRQVWVVLLNHLGRAYDNDRRGSTDAYREPLAEEGFGTSEQEKSADAMLILWQWTDEDRRNRTFLKLAKSRQTNRGCVIELIYDARTQSFIEDGVRRSW